MMMPLTTYAAWTGATVGVGNFLFSIFKYYRDERNNRLYEQRQAQKEKAAVSISVKIYRSVNEPRVRRGLYVEVLNKSIYPINIVSVMLGKLKNDFGPEENIAGQILQFKGSALHYPVRIEPHHILQFSAVEELLTPQSRLVTVRDVDDNIWTYEIEAKKMQNFMQDILF